MFQIERLRDILSHRASKFEYLSHPPNVWLLLILPFLVFVVLLLGVGPTLQYYIFAYLNKDAISLYDSAYPSGIADFPSPFQWLVQTSMSWMAAPALFVTIASFRNLVFRDVLVRVVVSTFIALSVMDLIIEVASGSLTPDKTLINLTSDFTGSFLVGAISAGALWTYERLALGIGPVPGKVIAPLSIVLWGGFISLLSYSAFYFLYQPTSVRFELKTLAPVSGWIAGKGEKDGKPTSFTLLSNTTSKGPIKISNIKSAAILTWRNTGQAYRYSMTLGLVRDCFGVEDIGKLAFFPLSTFEDVKTVQAQFDRGDSEFDIGSNEKNSVTFHGDSLNTYWITPKDNSLTQIQYMVSPGDEIKVSSSGNNRIYIAGSTAQYSLKQSRLADRMIRVVVNGNALRIHIPHKKAFGKDQRLRCGPLHAANKAGVLTGQTPILVAGVLLQFKETPLPRQVLSMVPPQEMQFRNVSGWFESNGIPASEFETGDLGTTNLVTASAKRMSLFIDGKAIPVNGHDSVQAIGSIAGEYENGDLTFSGRPIETTYGETRLNPTKWERLPDDWQRWILVGVGGFLLALWRAGKPVLARAKTTEEIRVPRN